MQLDNFTVITITACTASLFGLGVVLFDVLQKTFKGFVPMGMGYLGLGIGIALVALRGRIPDFISISVSNTLLVASLFMLQEGLAQFTRGANKARGTAISTTLLAFITIFYFSTIEPSLQARIVSLSFFFVIPLALSARTVRHPLRGQLFVSQKITAVLAWASAGTFLTRGVLTIFHDPGTDYLASGNIQTLYSMINLITIIGYAFSTIWMSIQRYEAKLLEMAERDVLTGLYNRRALEDRAAQHLHLAERNARPLALILFDVDDFKAVNDTHGHKVGDRVLVELARAMSRTVRSHDVLARFGGEEFLILLPETTLSQAMDLAERLRLALKNIRIMEGDQPVPVSASFGVCARQGSQIHWDALVTQADAALYMAKQSGKDAVYACSG